MPNIAGKVAVITGAGNGIGRGIAAALGKSGVKVYISGPGVNGESKNGNGKGTVEKTAEIVCSRGGIGIPVKCDYSIDADILALFKAGTMHEVFVGIFLAGLDRVIHVAKRSRENDITFLFLDKPIDDSGRVCFSHGFDIHGFQPG